ncbi:hypothetical protein MYSTI_07379 [Myxococcus stipitatus DSM 14675]|uniref:Phosphoribosyltransferase domain-containing protein n=1 Tax=Myxococcus stipitatus (strain DSM 14675 / JCM 12634 / Mx s8) TaxID=1278073 RepID=L7UI55_MYXSD|nr:phosphoribosyltransferase [Myxococcus stipitatus]AGC48651.1 hypothetical protein MYSTI_07379 [Myxococcus stipitatus DSM 14675]
MPKYVGEQGENRLFQRKDLAGFYYVSRLLLEEAESLGGKFLYVGLGRSPVVVMEFLRQVFGIKAVDFPLSIETTKKEYEQGKRDVPYDKAMSNYIEKYLPRELLEGRRLILVDYVDSGYSLMSAQALMEHHLKTVGLHDEAKHVYIAPLTELEQFLQHEKSVLKKFSPDISAAHRLLKVLKATIDKEPFARFPRTSEAFIRAGNFPVSSDEVENRLRAVMKLAIEHMGEDKEGALEKLESAFKESKYALEEDSKNWFRKRRNPGRTLNQSFSFIPTNPNRRRSDVEKEHLNNRYSRLSSEEYGIPDGALSYRFGQASTYVANHPVQAAIGAILSILAIAYIFMLFKGLFSVVPVVDSSDRVREL